MSVEGPEDVATVPRTQAEQADPTWWARLQAAAEQLLDDAEPVA